MKYCLLALVLLAWPSSAAAHLDLSTVTFATAATADWVTTYQNRQYVGESNPLLAWLDHKPKAQVALGVAIDVASVTVWRKLTKDHKKLRAIGLYAAAAVRVAVAIDNYNARQEVRRRQRLN